METKDMITAVFLSVVAGVIVQMMLRQKVI